MIALERLFHPWEPVYDEHSRILILGSFPSPKSRENHFYYGHPQNIFWKTVAEVLQKNEPSSEPEARKKFLLDYRIAVWDVLESCEIIGARDDSIQNPVANDFTEIFEHAKIRKVFTTGKKGSLLYEKLCYPINGVKAEYLPSTSPANRALQSKPEFWEKWRQIGQYLDGDEK